jgi:hypothetical protein
MDYRNLSRITGGFALGECAAGDWTVVGNLCWWPSELLDLSDKSLMLAELISVF